MDYEDFELQIGPQTVDGVLVRARCQGAHAEATIQIPEILAGPLPRDLERAAARLRSNPTDLGGQLFGALFPETVAGLFRQCWKESLASEHGLRIRLVFNPDDPTLAPLRHIPWELLFRTDTREFLALNRRTPVVRSLAIPRPVPPFLPKPPLRILVVQAQPSEGPSWQGNLNLAQELTELRTALKKNPFIEVECLECPDVHRLRETLRSKPFHVLHFMGHGTFDRRTGEGALIFEGPGRPPEIVTGRHLSTKIADLGHLRLIVLNACNTAIHSSADLGHDPFAGVASALLLGGTTAVIAMQSPIEDPHAIAFSSMFYDELAQGSPIDEAVTEGRQAIYSKAADRTDWAIPVVFLRAPSGDMRTPLPPPPKPPNRTNRTRLTSLLAILLAVALVSGLLPQFSPPLEIHESWRPLPIRTPAPPPSNLAKPKAGLKAEGQYGSVSIAITGPSAPATFQSALRRQLAKLLDDAEAAPRVAGKTLQVEISRPQRSNTFQDGFPWNICRYEATGRLGSVPLDPASAVRSNALAEAACSKAAEALAEEVVIKVNQVH
jgi:hypothetical protein